MLTKLTLWSKATLIYIAMSSLAAHFLSMAAGHLNGVIAGISIVCGMVSALYFYGRSPREKVGRPVARTDWFLLLALFVFIGRYFLYLFYPAEGEWRTLHSHNLGDLPLHLTYIKHLARGAVYPAENPFYAGHTLLYPLGMDLHNALYEVLGWSTPGHLLAVGILMTAVLLIVLYSYGGWPLTAGLLLNGGFFAWWWMSRQTDPPPAVWAWKNFITSLWITQRGLLWSIPAGVILIDETKRALREKRSFSWLACALLAAMPFFHLHSFFFFVLFHFLTLLLARGRWPEFFPLIFSVPLSSYFLFRSTQGFSQASVVHWRWGWMAENEGFFKFWLWNLGPWLFLFAWQVRQLWRKTALSTESIMAIAFLFLWLVFCGLMFAPWDWDNIKLLIWPYIGLLYLVEPVWRGCRVTSATRSMVLCLLASGGLLSLAQNSEWRSRGLQIYSQQELNSLAPVLKEIPVNSVFAALPTFQHPLSYFGFKLTSGYPGHLWSHGIDSEQRELLLQRIMTGDAEWPRLVEELKIDYIFWGERERQKYGSSPSWRSQLKNISPLNGVEIYATKK